MADISDEELKAAAARGRVEFQTTPHAASARFDRLTGLMTLELYSGCTFSFMPRDLQGMAGATDAQLEAVDLGLTGYGLHWEELDADFTVPGLLAGRFGTARFMQERENRLGEVYDRLVRDRLSHDWVAQAAE